MATEPGLIAPYGVTIYRTVQYSFLALAVRPGTLTETRKA